MNNKGFVPILIVILIALAVGGYLLYQKQTPLRQDFVGQAKPVSQECSSNNGSAKLTLDEAKKIALQSDCLKEGTFTNTEDYCNSFTETWWLTMKPSTGNCGLACVVNVNTKTANAQYMCTGVIPPGT